MTTPRFSRPRQATMRDVAVRAGVSVQTVSNVVNDRVGEVAAETRDRVLRAMAALEYVPNLTARSLRSARQHVIGFLVLDEGARFLADPMTDLVIAGVGDVARENGYGVFIQASQPGRVDEGLLAPLLEHRVDGACLWLSGEPRSRNQYVKRIAELGYPFVLLGDTSDPSISSVTADNYLGAQSLVQHLLQRGHDRIAFMTTRVSWPMVDERHRGYRDALRAAGLRLRGDYYVRHGTWDPQSGSEAVARLLALPEPPTAVLAGNDLLALGLMQGAKLAGLRIPEDLAVVGFNDFQFAAFVDPALTTVAVPGYEMGRTAVEMLIDQLERDAPPRRARLAVQLRVRSSS